MLLSMFQLFFFGKVSCNFSGGRTKYSTLTYKSTLADFRFRRGWVGEKFFYAAFNVPVIFFWQGVMQFFRGSHKV